MVSFDDCFSQALEQLKDHSCLRTNGRPLAKGQKDFLSNDYLGFTRHLDAREDILEWLDKFGMGSSGSPLVSGNNDGLIQIQKEVASFKEMEDARIFSSGWQALASLVPVFIRLFKKFNKEQFVVIADRLMHASFYYSCQAAGIHPVRFRHNDCRHLEEILEKYSHCRKIIFTESVFSMEGDCAPIDALWDLSQRYGAFLCIDEAHSTGIMGKRGQGLANGQADLIIGTFSKALGSMGAFIAASKTFCRYLENTASGYIYSTALSPVILGCVHAALRAIPHCQSQREHVASLSQEFREIMHAESINTSSSLTHIVPVIIADEEKTLALEKYLREQNFRVGAIRPPSVPPHSSRLRITFHAHNSREDMYQLAHHLLKMLKG